MIVGHNRDPSTDYDPRTGRWDSGALGLWAAPALSGFDLTDAAGLASFYGTPAGTAVSGGPLTLAITAI